MATSSVSRTAPRVSRVAATLLSLSAGVDSYWSRKAFGDELNEWQMRLCAEERDALNLIHRGLFRLFPFDPDRDMPDTMERRHAI